MKTPLNTRINTVVSGNEQVLCKLLVNSSGFILFLAVPPPRGDSSEASQPLVKNPRIPRLGRRQRAGRLASGRSAHCVDHCSLRRTRLRQPVRTGDPAGSRYPSRQIASGHRSAPSGETRNLVRKLQFESSPEETLGQSSSPIRTAEGTKRQLVRLSAAASRFPSRKKSTMEENL